MKKHSQDPKFVLIRARDAGVHAGTLVSHSGRTVVLKNAVRIWRWRGPRTLNELANHGVEPGSKGHTRVSEKVDEISILDACEIITVQPKAEESILHAGWAK